MLPTRMRLDEGELGELASTVAAYCRDRLPDPTDAKPGQRRDPEQVRTQWLRMAGELGIGELLIDEELGGAGAGLVEATRVAETLSAELAAVPYLTSAVFAPILLAAIVESGGPNEVVTARALLTELAAGSTVMTIAYLDVGGSPHDASVLDGETASGSFGYVVDGDVADRIILVGADGAELAVADAADLTVLPGTPFDLTRGLASVTADGARVRVLAAGNGRAAFDGALAAVQLATAADSSGGALAALAEATAYARDRIQFGRSIGSFQAIKHILADRFVDTELALSVSRLAVEATVDASVSAAERLALARFYCADRFVRVAADAIQIHGGMGFTAECRAHLYRRRAASNRYLFGTADSAKSAYTAIINGRENS